MPDRTERVRAAIVRLRKPSSGPTAGRRRASLGCGRRTSLRDQPPSLTCISARSDAAIASIRDLTRSRSMLRRPCGSWLAAFAPSANASAIDFRATKTVWLCPYKDRYDGRPGLASSAARTLPGKPATSSSRISLIACAGSDSGRWSDWQSAKRRLDHRVDNAGLPRIAGCGHLARHRLRQDGRTEPIGDHRGQGARGFDFGHDFRRLPQRGECLVHHLADRIVGTRQDRDRCPPAWRAGLRPAELIMLPRPTRYSCSRNSGRNARPCTAVLPP